MSQENDNPKVAGAPVPAQHSGNSGEPGPTTTGGPEGPPPSGDWPEIKGPEDPNVKDLDHTPQVDDRTVVVDVLRDSPPAQLFADDFQHAVNTARTEADSLAPDGYPGDTGGVIPSIWELIPAVPSPTGSYHTESIPVPDSVFVSKHFGVRRFLDISGDQADEALAHLIARRAMTVGGVQDFKNVFWNGGLVSRTVENIWKNKTMRLIRGKAGRMAAYAVLEGCRKAILDANLNVPREVELAYSHVFLRVLAHLDLAVFPITERIVEEQEHLVPLTADIKRALVRRAVLEMFNEQRYREIARKCGPEVNPTLLTSLMVEELRRLTTGLNSLAELIVQYDDTLALLRHYLLDSSTVPEHLKGLVELRDLGRYANLIHDAFVTTGAVTYTEIYQLEYGVKRIARELRSIGEYNIVSRDVFSSWVGFTPVESKHWFKGGVAWAWLDARPSFEVVEHDREDLPARVHGVTEELTHAEMRKRGFNTDLFGREGVRGAAHIVATSINLTNRNTASPPILRVLGLSKRELSIYALLNATSLAVTRSASRPVVVFHVPVTDRWIMQGAASTSTEVIFTRALDASMYLLSMKAGLQELLPQGIPTSEQRPLVHPTEVVGFTSSQIKPALDDRVTQPFMFRTVVRDPNSPTGRANLDFSIPMLPGLTTLDPATGRELRHVEAVRPAYVMNETADRRWRDMFSVVAGFLQSKDPELRNQATSWIYVFIAEVAKSDLIVSMTLAARDSAYQRAQLDGRTHSASGRRAAMRTLVAVIFGTLYKYRKIRGADATIIISRLNTAGISPIASRAWAQAFQALGSTSSWDSSPSLV